MDLKEIRQIIEMMKRNDLSLFHLEREGFKIKLRKGVDFDTMVDKLGSSGSGMSIPHIAPAAPSAQPVDHAASGSDADADAADAPSPAGNSTPARVNTKSPPPWEPTSKAPKRGMVPVR